MCTFLLKMKYNFSGYIFVCMSYIGNLVVCLYVASYCEATKYAPEVAWVIPIFP